MMNETNIMQAIEHDDAELVSQSLAGNREAFGQIVARYQSLVCSLAYSATGNLSQSEDLAQETFLAAWKRLGELREAAKLRGWLCGIARNLINNAFRSLGREPTHRAGLLEAAQDAPAREPLPSQQAISREEEAILWRSLERIPETYREPLILFYREHQSIEQVARALDLSEEATKQRLSRGRKLLHAEVVAFVEGALEKTSPGQAFTLGVLAALPMLATSAKAAGMAAAAGKTAVAKGASALAWATVVIGPVLGLLGAWLGTKASIDNTASARERRFMVRASKIAWAYILGFDALIAVLALLSGHGGEAHTLFWTLAFGISSLGFAGGLLALVLWTNRRQRQIRLEEAARLGEGRGEARRGQADYFEYRSRRTLLGLPLVHICGGRGPDGKVAVAKGWIACGGVSIGVLFSCGGIAIGGVSFGGLAIGAVAFGGWGIGLLAIAGLSMGVWAAGGAAAFGYLAIGGAFALAWKAACAGTAIAHHYALGQGLALAEHANDAVAQAFVRGQAFFRLSDPRIFSLAVGLCWLPLLVVLWQSIRIRKKLRDAGRGGGI